MSTKNTILRVVLLSLLLGVVASVPALAGSAVIGSVAGSMNATVGGQSLLPNTTIFSGDSLQVRDGVAVVAVGNTSRMVFGRDTVASFLKDANEVTVLLSQGSVSMFHPNEGTSVRVKAGDVSVVPAAGFKTLGEVAMLNGSVVISAKEGSLQVNGRGTTKNVAKGQTIVIAPKTADAKKGTGNGWGGGGNGWDIAAVAAGGTAAVLAGVGISRANGAKNSADAATAAGNAATAAANTANASAQAALTAAQAATAAAAQAAFEAGCTYNYVTNTGIPDSPYVPPTGQECPIAPPGIM
jgi:pyruvate/2-oxoglutarate dehydrogenase complex dihydrolipoamide acyltransferase (E2) component